MSRRVRIGIDVGGTFTKGVALETRSGMIIARATLPTTHSSKRGVSEGIVSVLREIISDAAISYGEIELVSHSTTQAINALLESDTHKVGVIAMGVAQSRKDVVKRTKLDGEGTGSLEVLHEFLDTSHLITTEEVQGALERLRAGGAEVVVATEAFGVDDPSNELFVMEQASKMGIPSTASHEISGSYGLEIRTLTAAVNASVLPKTFEVAEYIESAIREAGISSPLMVMRGDGGVTSMETFRTKPILTVLSGPAASVTGALLHLRVTNGVFVEVGGTSTNICIIRNGKPEIRYVTIRDHPTCIRSMDVRVLGVAGGSMLTIRDGAVSRVGPRSAHIAGLGYSCFADPRVRQAGEIVMIRPRDDDKEEYVAIRSGDHTYAITNTCAANALNMIDRHDYSYGSQESARVAMQKLGELLHMPFHMVAMSIIQTSSYEILKTTRRILKEFKMNIQDTKIIGGGGGASVLVPFVAKQLGIQYEKADDAEVISSIGVAASMIREELEFSMIQSTPEKISRAHRKIYGIMLDRGAVPESITIESSYMREKSILRVTATGNVDYIQGDARPDLLGIQECMERAAGVMGADPDSTRLSFESDHYMVFEGDVTEGRIFGKRKRRCVVILDRFGRTKVMMHKGEVIKGDARELRERVCGMLRARQHDIAPQVYLVNDLTVMDFSGLTSPVHVADAISKEIMDGLRTGIVMELK